MASQPAARPVTGTPAPGNADQAGVTPTLVITPKPGASSTTPLISYLAGSTVKLEQLNGEEDKQLQKPTLSQTFTRYGIQGSDLGYSFEHQGLEYFLFGDTVGKLDKALDKIATTDAVDPEKGMRLDYLMNGKNYLTVQPPGISMGAFETPIGGISLGDQMYVVVRTNHASDWSTDRSVLTHFTLPSTFQPVRTISQALGLWLMTFDSRPPGPAGIQFCYSKTPWGPWSAAQTIFEEVRDGALGKFIHDPKIKPDGGLEGPVIGTGQADPAAVKGGTYAPYVVERWTKIQGKELNLYYVLSTWNPYVVTLMKSRLQIT